MKYKFLKKIIVAVCLVLTFVLLCEAVVRVLPTGGGFTFREGISVGEKAIALTFDDGPGGHTEKLLDGLKKYDAKATFFVLGKNVEKRPETVKRAYDEGHLIANHTYDHPRLTLESVETVRDNFEKSTEIIASVTGEKPVFVRPPYGDLWAYQLKSLDYYFINWSVNAFDWDVESSDEVYEGIIKNAEDGAIILLHDTKETTVDAVLRAIPELQAQGYEFVRADDLLTRNGDEIKKGVTYRKCEDGKNPFVF